LQRRVISSIELSRSFGAACQSRRSRKPAKEDDRA
jgi:hypothetical protein